MNETQITWENIRKYETRLSKRQEEIQQLYDEERMNYIKDIFRRLTDEKEREQFLTECLALWSDADCSNGYC